ncbi:MAG: hypothetical protein AB1778_08595 [Candidatus Bipolaricaulota bacterium]
MAERGEQTESGSADSLHHAKEEASRTPEQEGSAGDSPARGVSKRHRRTSPPDVDDLIRVLKQDLPPPNFEAEIGRSESIPEPDVDISLHPSRETPIAGELWSVMGEVRNRSQSPIWIVDTTTMLSLAPEMYGQMATTGSVNAFFPTMRTRPQAEVVRIDPGANYTVVWKLDPGRQKHNQAAAKSIWRRIISAIRNFAFFNPGSFRLCASVHIWSAKPTFNETGQVANLGDSFCRAVSRDITMDASPWVLIVGAVTGGVLAYALQLAFGLATLGGTSLEVLRGVLVGLSSSCILTGVVTVLVSRLATTDFLVVVRVKDIWGAIATGFVVQWFGYSILTRLLGGLPA